MSKKGKLSIRIEEFVSDSMEALGALIGCALAVAVGFGGLYLAVRMIKWMWEQ